MKKMLSFFLIAALVSTRLNAQPLPAQVKTDFQKNGVTAVEGITFDKETHLDHNRWKASFHAVTPVKPDEVDGKAGVTLVKHMIAWYECSGKTCRLTGSFVNNSEYKGMDIPAPDTKELANLVKRQMMTEPSFLVSTMELKASFDSVKVIDPKIDWINPTKLVFAAKIYYTEKVGGSEIAAIESPVSVTLKRPDLKSEFIYGSAIQYNERNAELSRKKINQGNNKPDPETTPPPPVAGAWKKGDKVKVEENGKWYPATVLYAKGKEWFIHYDGYDSQFDEWAVGSRIKNK